ncbi:NAD(P)/FAD-dependent oxidoreductase [Bosea sp. (in: a-proteobacteria)]|uniref:NAD(P)/FAD-dependent oxidoreductase n=1 Tax=Bosea sp. (in: a-proteobacteria) TaxID=1871050 RepID=UPI002FC77959
MTASSSSRVAVIGAGIVGLAAALEIQRSGHHVILIEPDEPGGRQSASYGNGCWLNPGAILPISLPGLWRKVPGFLLDPTGPFVIRWRDLPGLAGWLLDFVLAGRNWRLVEACARTRFELCRSAVDEHIALAQEAGVPELIRREGVMYVYLDRSEFLAEERVWRMRREFGVAFSEVGEAELRAMQPELAARYRFGARLDGGAYVVDPGAYCRALAELVVRRGGERVIARASSFEFAAGQLQAVRTETGPVACDQAVIAAGIGSAALARQAGDRVPLISERGYNVVIPEPGFDIPCGLMPSDGLMGVVATRQGLRLAGQVELASVSAPPNWRRTEILQGFAGKMFPQLKIDETRVDRWMGHRPSTPDGLPCIGVSSGSADVFHCFGHSHTGLIQAPTSGRLVAALVDGRAPPLDPAPFSAGRFG